MTTTPSLDLRQLLRRAPVMPILTIDDASQAPDLAKALIAGGLHVFEVLVRTPAALQAIANIARACPEAVVGAGTLLTAADVDAAIDAGAAFGVSPGLTPALAAAVRAKAFPFLPGVSSASEVMAALESGFLEQKFFPAHGGAGVAGLKMLGPVFPKVLFCPTGGITAADVPHYLKLDNCTTVGSSWVSPAALIRERNWSAITELAAQAVAIARELGN